MADDRNRDSDYSRNKEQPLPFLPEDDDPNLTASGNPYGPDSFQGGKENERKAAQNNKINGGSFSGIGGANEEEQKRREEKDKSQTAYLMTLTLAQLVNNAYQALDDSNRSIDDAANKLNASTAASDAYRDTTFMESYMEYSKEALALEELNKQLEEAKANGDQAKITELNEKIAQQEITKKQALDKYEIAAKPMNDAYTKRTELTTQLEELKIKQDELRKSLDGATDADKATIAKQLEELKIKQEALDIKAAELDTTLAGFQSQITQANAAMTGDTTQAQEHLTLEMQERTLAEQFKRAADANGILSLRDVDDFARKNPDVSMEKIAAVIGNEGLVLNTSGDPTLQKQYSPLIDDNNIVKVPDYSNNDVAANYSGVDDLGPTNPAKQLEEQQRLQQEQQLRLAQQQPQMDNGTQTIPGTRYAAAGHHPGLL
ncbi:MAG TPA: hypothetical protein DEA55_08955 [Rhodospirillaceae bacterium]|nr:hypothetical protein [Rhodospirillaceae bacterium]